MPVKELMIGTGVRGEDWDSAVEDAQTAEAQGFDFLRFADQAANRALEGWTLATAIAARTERVKVLHGTLNLPWRHPPFLAKMAAALDNVSHGRLILCLGAGGTLPFLLAEYQAYGVYIGTQPQRYANLRDFIITARGMWTHDSFSYESGLFQVKDAVCLPKPANGVIPIWIGAGGPSTQRLIGRLADGWMRNRGWPTSLDEFRGVNATIDAAAVAAGRDPGAIRRNVNGSVAIAASSGKLEAPPAAPATGVSGTPDQAIEQFREIIAAGADSFGLSFADNESRELFVREVLPVLRQTSLATA